VAHLKHEVEELRNSSQHSFSSTPTSAQSYTSDRGSFMDPAHLQVFNELLKVSCFHRFSIYSYSLSSILQKCILLFHCCEYWIMLILFLRHVILVMLCTCSSWHVSFRVHIKIASHMVSHIWCVSQCFEFIGLRRTSFRWKTCVIIPEIFSYGKV